MFAGTISDIFSSSGVYGGGVYRRPLADVIAGVSTPVSNAALPFRLEQNYPNPFNPATSIRYSLPGRSHVTLTVFTVLGQQVATLVNENQEAGSHEIRFDGSGLATGVYFYRIQAGGFVRTKRLLLLR